MKKIFIGLLAVSMLLVVNNTKSYGEQWAKTYGSPIRELALSIQQTTGEGYIVAGFRSGSFEDIWLLKLDTYGDITWQKTYEADNALVTSIQQTLDNGYIVAGTTTSIFDHGRSFWVLKLNSSGDVTWEKTYSGGEDLSYVNPNIKQTTDGGYIVGGYTSVWGTSESDFIVLKLDSSGNVLWQKTYGGSGDDEATSIQETTDGGYIVAGNTNSFGAGGGNSDVLIIKLDSSGNVLWQKTYGGLPLDNANSIQQTIDGGYIVAGFTLSFGDNKGKFWVFKLDDMGNIQWEKIYVRGVGSVAYSIQQTSDLGFVVAGYSTFSDTLERDFWVLRLTNSGDITWEIAFNGGGKDYPHSVQQTSDGGFIVAGLTSSLGAGDDDMLVLKLDSNGVIPNCDFISTTNAIVSNTNAIVNNSDVIIQSVTPQTIETSSPTFNTSAEVSTACCYDIEDNDYDCVQQAEDNCPNDYNPSQEDSDGNGIGDACETGDEAIPTLSEWGLIIFMTLILGIGVITLLRTRKTAV